MIQNVVVFDKKGGEYYELVDYFKKLVNPGAKTDIFFNKNEYNIIFNFVLCYETKKRLVCIINKYFNKLNKFYNDKKLLKKDFYTETLGDLNCLILLCKVFDFDYNISKKVNKINFTDYDLYINSGLENMLKKFILNDIKLGLDFNFKQFPKYEPLYTEKFNIIEKLKNGNVIYSLNLEKQKKLLHKVTICKK